MTGSAAEVHQDGYKGSIEVPSNLNCLWFHKQAAVEEVEEREYRIFEPGLLLKLCCENIAPGPPEQGES